jgi:predicted Zn-dependent protease
MDSAREESIQKRKKFNEDSRLHMTLGQLYTSQRRYEQAIAAYQKARTLKPEQPVIPVRLVRLYLRSGLMQEAESEMQVLDQMMKDGQHSRELFVEAATSSSSSKSLASRRRKF